jgi:IclR family acetate operon transcriptional repressor
MVAREPAGDERSLILRTFSILDTFTTKDSSLGLAELAKQTGLPKTTVHRIASNLVRVGALERGDGDFRLGLYLFELGQLVPEQRRLRDAALPFLVDLYEASKEVIHLGVLAERDVLYVVKIAGHDQVPLPTREGGRMPATCTSLGKAILAFSPRATIKATIEGGLTRITPYSIVEPSVLLDQLAQIARDGVAYEREESVLGNVCVGAPILEPGRQVRAAISVAGPTSRFQPDRMAAAVRVAASATARRLANQRLNDGRSTAAGMP